MNTGFLKKKKNQLKQRLPIYETGTGYQKNSLWKFLSISIQCNA